MCGVIEADEELRELKREVIESRGLAIKSNNLVSSLAADVKAIAKRQAGYERRLTWNSGAAYAIIAVLCFVGIKLASDARVSEERAGKEELERQVKSLRSELQHEVDANAKRYEGEKAAMRMYELYRRGKQDALIASYEESQVQALSGAERAFFADAVRKSKLDRSVRLLHEGLELFRTGRYAESVDRFRGSVEGDAKGTHAPEAQFYLARAYRKLERHNDALALAKEVVAQKNRPDLHPDAMFLIALSHESLEQLDDATDAYHQVINKWPRSEYTPDARRRIADVRRRIFEKRRTM